MGEPTVPTGRTRCCIVGGGPAGMMLAVLLARGGVCVTLLEKHADFLRDFRGDTVHPSTLQILDDIGLLATFEKLPHRKEPKLLLQFADGMVAFGDFRGLEPFPYIAFVPQWDFLDLLADEGRLHPSFRLHMQTAATELLREDGRVVGVRATSPDGPREFRADLVVATDGRGSVLRTAAGLRPRDFGAPMDALWFRLPMRPGDPEGSFGITGSGQLIAMIHRVDYWQVALMIPKGGFRDIRTRSIEDFRGRLAKAAPLLADRVDTLASFDAVHLLEVKVDRLEHWHAPGLLFLGDAAHAMSPVGGVGINLAIQDAVAAANLLGPTLRDGGEIPESLLAEVQDRRLLPTRLIQGIQVAVQKRVIAPALVARGGQPDCPPLLRTLLRSSFVRSLPARIFGLGFRRERVRFGPRA